MVHAAGEAFKPLLDLSMIFLPQFLTGSLAIAFLSGFHFFRCQAGAEPPSARLLLEGVASIREQIPPSRLRMLHSFQSAFVHNRYDSTAWFDRERRFYETVSSNYNQPSRVRMYFDGREVGHFSAGGSSSVEIRNLDSGTPDFFCDPRVLGITTVYAWDDTIRGCLRLEAQDIHLLGREEIDGTPCWRVRAVMPMYNLQTDFWIDDQSRFALLQVEEWLGKQRLKTVRSHYDNPNYPWLPSRIETVERGGEGVVRDRREILIVEAEAGVAIAPDTFSLAGLLRGQELPELVPVTDARQPEIIGYWSKGRLWNPDLTDLWEEKSAQPPAFMSSRRKMLMAAMTLLLLAPLAFLWWRQTRRPPAPTDR